MALGRPGRFLPQCRRRDGHPRPRIVLLRREPARFASRFRPRLDGVDDFYRARVDHGSSKTYFDRYLETCGSGTRRCARNNMQQIAAAAEALDPTRPFADTNPSPFPI